MQFAKFLPLILLTTSIFAQRPAPLAPATPVHDRWVGSWATSPLAAKNPSGHFGGEGAAGTTLREFVHLSIGGPALRVIFTNEFGQDPLTIDAASVALRSATGDLIAGSATPLTFSGHPSIVIPPGALVVSDPANLKVAPLSDLAVSFFLPDQTLSQLTLHPFADTTSFYAPGNNVDAPTLPDAKKIVSWDFLKGVDVSAPASAASIVTFGDSITDGAHSTRDANLRWPDILAARLQANPRTKNLGVLNQGIGGNRILHDVAGPSALARFDRDVLAQTGVKYLIILEAINDIRHAADPVKPFDMVSADDLIAGFSQMARRAHAHGIKVIGATLTPYVGAEYQSPAGEAMRQAVNAWIRSTQELDGVIDFDKATVDPANPAVFLPAYDSSDHLHPSDAGYKAMGESIDLNLFKENNAPSVKVSKPAPKK